MNNIIPFTKNAENQNESETDNIHAKTHSKTESRYPHPIPRKRPAPSPEWLIATLTNKIYSDRNRKKNRSDYWF